MILGQVSSNPGDGGLTYAQRKQIFDKTPELIKLAFGMTWVKGYGYRFGNGVFTHMNTNEVRDFLANVITFTDPSEMY